jgi:alpha-ketoglutarate-dependent taurine dioxygenase
MTTLSALLARGKTAAAPQPLDALSSAGLASSQTLQPDRPLPLVIQPRIDGVDLPEWIVQNREVVEAALRQHGGLLFRGFPMEGQSDFERFVARVCPNTMTYMEGATPRTQLTKAVYTSTEYPAERTIALHNELTYVRTWPGRIVFFCVVAAADGGETPIADVRRVLGRLRPETVAPFAELGWMLVRNFGPALSMTWQNAFRTESRDELERYCVDAGIAVEWLGGDRLRTRQVRPALARHLVTGELAWFNHVAFWHASSLDPATQSALVAHFGWDGLPYNTFYGDGSPISEDTVEEIRQAYREETIAFPWQPSDLLLLDNMLAAHGRRPFSGARRILVAMSDPCSDRGL